MKIINDRLYHWLMINMPYYIMYKHTWIDTQHKIWLPRWGYSKQQLIDAEIQAKELSEKIKFE